jgi:glycosyltransferase involved in cell wall biosynthesis
MTQLSAVVITRNEEDNIEGCLASLSFVDEILVIDDYSTDNTIKLAKKYGARIIKRHLENDFAAQRNFALSKAEGKWVLFVDADEVVTRELANEITQCVNDPVLPFSGFLIKRIDEIWGRKILHGECGTIRLLRLIRKGSGKWIRPVHETYIAADKREKVYSLKNALMHYPHKTLTEFIADVDRMSTIHAEANEKEGKRSSIIKIIFWPPLKFIHNYFFKMGFRDGTQGFVIAAVMSFHSYLAWSKMYLLQKRKSPSLRT